MSAASQVTAPLDTIAPSKPTNLVVSEDGRSLTGSIEAYTTVRVYDANNKEVGSQSTYWDGQFSISLNNAYLKGQQLTVTVTDLAGNVSESTAVPFTDNSTASQQQSASRLYSILSEADSIDSSADDSTDTASDINLDELFSQQSESAPNDIFASLGISTDSSQPASSPEFIVLTLTERPDDLLTQQTVLF